MKSFPENFLWGAAISSYQTEGNNFASDWWTWEQQSGRIKDNSQSGLACDFWNRYEMYIDYARQAGMNALRISIEWARIQPKPDEWDNKAIEHYQHIIHAIKSAGIEPIITLWHFTLPQWLAECGGWLCNTAVDAFVEYVARIHNAFGNEITYWTILNEPMVYAFKAYGEGTWPPQKRFHIYDMWRVRKNLMRSHKAAYAILKTKQNKIGIAANVAWNDPRPWWNVFNRIVAGVLREASDFGFIRGIQNDLDFIGLNYYFHNIVHIDPKNLLRWSPVPSRKAGLVRGSIRYSNDNPKYNSDIGWEIAPEGILYALRTLYKTFHKPIMITENGLADAKDEKRAQFIRDHVENIAKAIHKNIPVMGYLHWSLMDNFEWADGKTPRFGLIAMDYETMTAHPRQSLWEYGALIRKNRGNDTL